MFLAAIHIFLIQKPKSWQKWSNHVILRGINTTLLGISCGLYMVKISSFNGKFVLEVRYLRLWLPTLLLHSSNVLFSII